MCYPLRGLQLPSVREGILVIVPLMHVVFQELLSFPKSSVVVIHLNYTHPLSTPYVRLAFVRLTIGKDVVGGHMMFP